MTPSPPKAGKPSHPRHRPTDAELLLTKPRQHKQRSLVQWLLIFVFLGVVGWFTGSELAVLTTPKVLPPKVAALPATKNKTAQNIARNDGSTGGLNPETPATADGDSGDTSTAAESLLAAAASALLDATKAFQPGPYRQGELVVQASSPEQFAALLKRAQAAGGTLLGSIDNANAARLSFPDAQSMGEFLQSGAGADSGDSSASAELNNTVSLPTPVVPVTDPYAPGSLQPFGSGAMTYMGVPQNNNTWGNGVMIAMLDTGLAPGTTNLLKDKSITELDLTNGSTTPPVGHGDMVASLLAGAPREQGITPAASILSIRVLDSNNEGDVFTVAQGIYAAVADGAKVLNLSLGTTSPSTVLQQAVNYALSQGVVVVAAAGNDGTGQISYPAAYPGVVAVGAIDATGTRATFSDFGPQLTVVAPGVGLNAVTTNGTMSFSGTSASSPLVAGAVAGLMSTSPGMTGNDAVALLTQYANFEGPLTDNGTQTNDLYGYGVVNLTRVLNRFNAQYFDIAVADMVVNVTTMPTTPTAPLQVTVQNRGNTVATQVGVTISYNGTDYTQTIPSLSPGDVQAVTVQLSVAQLTSAAGVQVTASVGYFGNDVNPNNNTTSRIVRLVQSN